MVDLNFQKYPAYKSSGVEWLGNIPEHWEVRKNSIIFKEVNETGYADLELLSILFDKGVVKQSETGRKERASEDRSNYKRILKGDIGYNLMNAFIGSIGVSSFDSGIISPAYAVCRPKVKLSSAYFHYLFRTSLYLAEFDRKSYGIMLERNRLYFNNFKSIYSLFPPLSEQEAIANFLDKKLAQIDEYIAKKQRMIELLKEQKTVIINQAVTKGINADVPMKFSGIEWLGEIPEHWEVRKIKRCLKSYRYGISDSIRGEGEFKILTMGNIQDGKVLIPKTVSLESVPESLILEYGDLLCNRTNSLELVGKVGFFRGSKEDKVSFASYLVRLKANHDANPVYLNFLLNSHGLLNVARQRSLVSLNQVNLNPTRYCQLTIPLPPISEQQEIVSFIEKKSEKIERAIATIEKEIKLIQEYRTTLISETVTGKINVRKYPSPNQKSKTFSE